MSSTSQPLSPQSDSAPAPAPSCPSRGAAILGAVVLLGLSCGFALGRSSLLEQWLPAPSAQQQWPYTLPELPPESTEAYRRLITGAADTVDVVMQRYPDDADAVAALALLHYLSHDPHGEQRCWERCLELDPRYELAYSRLVSLGEQSGDYDRIAALMRRALAIEPHRGDRIAMLASALSHAERYAEAREVLEAHLRTTSGTAGTYLLLGRAYERLNELEKAEVSLETAVALDPGRLDALYSLATVCAKRGQTQRAAEYRERFGRAKKNQLAEESKMGVRHAMADEQFTPLRVAEILRLAGEACLANNDAELAEHCLVQAVEVAPTNAESLKLLASFYGAVGRWDDALAVSEKLCRLEPEDLEHFKNRGVLYVSAGRFDEAERVFQDLCRQAPDRGVGYAGLAELYLRMGRPPQVTRPLADKAVELEPTAWNYAVLAALAERAGDRAAARTAVEQALALEPQNPKYRQLYESLEPAQ